MNEINAWGKYESGTTKTARRLDQGGTLRQRRPHGPSRQDISWKGHGQRPTTRRSLTLGDINYQPSVRFGADDIAAFKAERETDKFDDNPEIKDDDDAKETKEWKEVRDLARSVFHVYFTGSGDCDNDLQPPTLKKSSLLKKIDGTMPWLPALVVESSFPNILKELILFIEACFRGIGQVYFQNNPLSGVLILSAMFVQSSRVAVHAIIAIVCGNLSGVFMGFDKSFLSCGLFGYNTFLVGLAIATFDSAEMHMGYNWSAALGVVAASYFSTVLFVMLGKILSPYKTPPFTLPFDISTLAFLLAMKQITRHEVAEEATLSSTATTPLTAQAFFAGAIRGIGQVLFANDIISCVLVLLGIMVCSRISAVAAFVGSLIGAGVAALVGQDAAAIEDGIYGFNASLTLTAMVLFYVPSVRSVSLGIVASVFTVFIQLALEEVLRESGLPFNSLPFNLAALVFIVIQGTTSSVISVPLSTMTTPEDHLKRVSRLSYGFDLLFRAIQSSSHQKSVKKTSQRHASTIQISSVLDEYAEGLHGRMGGEGFLKYVRQLLCGKRVPPSNAHGRQSIRKSWINKDVGLDDEKLSYQRMFAHIDSEQEHKISKSQFEAFLRSIKFNDEVGLNFALETFDLMDLDGSSSMDLEEFIAFAKISRHMPAERSLVVKFFEFVDVDGDQVVDFEELDSACEYLNLPALSEGDRNKLSSLCNADEELEFDTIANFVTIFKLKSIIKDYEKKKRLNDTVRCSAH